MSGTAQGYAAPARALHWLVAVLVLAVWPLGFLIGLVREDAKPAFYLLHESLGLVILWLMLARIAVRLIRRPPPPVSMPAPQRILAAGVHAALYIALVAQPILGFLATNAFGFPLEWFGLFVVPSPIAEDQTLAPRLLAAHVTLGYAILALFMLHIAGVLWHRIVLRDGQLQRMS